MSSLEIVRYYSSLLIIQYSGKPKAQAEVELHATSDMMLQTSVQEIRFEGIPIDGEAVFSYLDVSAPAVLWNDSAATIQTKLRTIPALAAVTVTGSPQDGLVTVTFIGVLPPAELLVVVSSTLSYGIDGGFPDSTFSTELDGGTPTTEGEAITGLIDGGSPLLAPADILDGGDPFSAFPDVVDAGGPGDGFSITIDAGSPTTTYAGFDVETSVVETDEILPLAVQSGFNLLGDSPAVGKQLDVIGKYVGISRIGVGFTGQIVLNDADFLRFIQLGIVRNHAKALLYDIQLMLQQFFGSSILVFDYRNMRISYLISEDVGSLDLIQLFVTQGMLPKPMGVQLAAVVFAPFIDRFFGCRTYWAPQTFSTPFNSYTSYQLNRPWLSYGDAVTL